MSAFLPAAELRDCIDKVSDRVFADQEYRRLERVFSDAR